MHRAHFNLFVSSQERLIHHDNATKTSQTEMQTTREKDKGET